LAWAIRVLKNPKLPRYVSRDFLKYNCERPETMSEAPIEKRVEEYLRNLQMLEHYWQGPIALTNCKPRRSRGPVTRLPGCTDDELRHLIPVLQADLEIRQRIA